MCNNYIDENLVLIKKIPGYSTQQERLLIKLFQLIAGPKRKNLTHHQPQICNLTRSVDQAEVR